MTPPRKLDPEATRASIIDAAARLFVARGVNGVSLNDIAREAGVTKSLIHHHFGIKRDLWTAVKLSGIQPYLDWQRELLETRGADQSLLLESIVGYFRFLQTHPDVVRLMTWIAIEPGTDGQRDTDLIELGVARLREGQGAGLIRDDIDPRSMLLAFLSLCEHFFQYRHVMGCAPRQTPEGGAAPASASDPEAEAFLDTVLKVVAAGLRPEV